MAKTVNKVLIVGGGFSGMSAAIQLRKLGIETHLVEIDENWRPEGAGISIGGATLRAFRELGILEQFLEHGSGHDGLKLFTAHGHLIEELQTPRFVAPDVPGGGAIMRPVLGQILSDQVKANGTVVKLGCTYASFEQDADGVSVEFTDGSTDRFDLMIAADGLFSKTREALMPDAEAPSYSGQGVWRAVLPRPADCTGTQMWVGPHLKTGINPMSKDQVYLFLTADSVERQRFPKEEEVGILKGLLKDNFSAPEVQALADQINDDSFVQLRPLDHLLVQRPWFKERVVMIGDTVHGTIPHLASGACIGIEDAIVLAEELDKEVDITTALTAFQDRRFERCRMVVENSARLGQIEIEGGDKEEHATIMRESMMALAQPI
jgi:2-polyprenyl-6-methoxyphenol hydroxylase-like FAD-dependent oxidoreductase